MDRIECIDTMICDIMSQLHSAFELGIDKLPTAEVGEVADILKDLSETERNFRQVEYYKVVTAAMSGSDYVVDKKEDGEIISPEESFERYLEHIQDIWEHANPSMRSMITNRMSNMTHTMM